ncbi:DUF2523 domain-containing protein [Pseudomonas lundensis]|uniref:DUF2523 domain-containing protein n=1 Tax=Pseudomonas lundensis TaxID=86185 RepID=UPI0006544ECF|nr:DUF2523 domain-containing protein [Pseudomonas lundensis]KMM87393.1 hypothetical protein TU74_17950 [Pseudomonas lundensis]NNA22275.1 DUF2523 domain-containing protein [Pseudomonas lundensis]
MSSLLKLFGIESIRNLLIKCLSGLGFGYLTYKGLDLLLGMVTDQVMQNFNSLPANMLSIMGLGDLDHAVNMTLSAYAARFAMASVKKLKVLGAGQ